LAVACAAAACDAAAASKACQYDGCLRLGAGGRFLPNIRSLATCCRKRVIQWGNGNAGRFDFSREIDGLEENSGEPLTEGRITNEHNQFRLFRRDRKRYQVLNSSKGDYRLVRVIGEYGNWDEARDHLFRIVQGKVAGEEVMERRLSKYWKSGECRPGVPPAARRGISFIKEVSVRRQTLACGHPSF